MFSQEITLLRQDIADRIAALMPKLQDELKTRGIRVVHDETADETYCRIFLDETGDTPLRVREARMTPDIVLSLEDVDERYLGEVSLSDIGTPDGMIAVMSWFGSVLAKIDESKLRVIDGNVVPFTFRAGDHVRHRDPAIMNFAPAERAIQNARVYIIDKVVGDIAYISDGYSEAEVPVSELVPYTDMTFTEPKQCEMYDIHTGCDGTRRIHIFGWFWSSGDERWHLTEATGLDVPLADFIREYEKYADRYLESLWEGVGQCERDCTADEALAMINTFFDGVGPERNVHYRRLTEDILDGNYMSCESLPMS